MEDAGGEQPGGPRQGSDFQNLHRNKRAMTLNLKDSRGLEVFQRALQKTNTGVDRSTTPPISSQSTIEASPSPSTLQLVDAAPVKIDKSQLTFGEPRRLRDKAHLKFVATQPCLICGRSPADAHLS
jgi:hypothetical protein